MDNSTFCSFLHHNGGVIMADSELLKILKDLYIISGFRVSLHNTEFDELASYPEENSQFCRLVQENPKARLQCTFTDKDAFERVRHSGRIYVYKCRFGLYEAACPIYKNGGLSGYLMMGQAREDSSDADIAVISEALRYVDDRKRLEEALLTLPPVASDKIRAFADIMTLCAEHLAAGTASDTTPTLDLAASVIRYINRNIGKKLTLRDIASEFNCSKSTLMKIFKEKCGVTVNEYIIDRRISIAKELLQYSELSVGEISEKCGYPDQLYFSKAFSARIGVSPTKFRKDPFGKIK